MRYRQNIPEGRECNHPLCGPTCKKKKSSKGFYRIPKVSVKRKKINDEIYSPLSKKIRQENPKCKVNSPVCIGITQGVHHTRGRVGKHLTAEQELIPSCNPCNHYVETHPSWAKERGLKVADRTSKLTGVRQITINQNQIDGTKNTNRKNTAAV